MKQVLITIGILFSTSLMGQSWERIIKTTPMLDIVKDSTTLRTKKFSYQYPDRNDILSKDEKGYILVSENINYKYPKNAIDFRKEEALNLIFKNKSNSLKCKDIVVNMDDESKSTEKWQDNFPISCFQIKKTNYSIVTIIYSDPSSCSDNFTYLYLLNKYNYVSDTLLVGRCISEFDPHIGGFFNLKDQTIMRRSVINFGGKNSRNLYEFFEIDIKNLKFKKIYAKESQNEKIKTLDQLKAEKMYISKK